jgi:hypothetical protein
MGPTPPAPSKPSCPPGPVRRFRFGEVLSAVHDAVADRQQVCALVMLMQPRANDSDGAAMMNDFINVVCAINKLFKHPLTQRFRRTFWTNPCRKNTNPANTTANGAGPMRSQNIGLSV